MGIGFTFRGIHRILPRYFSRFFVGADNGQQVHASHGAHTEEIERVLRENFGPFRRWKLSRNFRNTYETYRFARQFVSRANLVAWDDAILHRLDRAARHGPKPVVVNYSDIAARNEHLRVTLENADGNVAILCPLGPGVGKYSGESVDEIHELVTKLGFEASKYHHKTDAPKVLKRYVVTTFKSSKGMEFSTIIIPRINFFKNIRTEWYVACTRARGNLVVYCDTVTPQCNPILTFDPDTYEAEILEKNPTVDAVDKFD